MRAMTMLLALLAAGCSGGGKADVTGKVRLGGKLLASGSVTFHPDGGGTTHGSGIGQGGDYQVRDLMPGKWFITVRSHSFVPPGLANPGGQKPDPEAGKIPERYNKPETSQKFVVVTGPGQQHDIDLDP